MKLLKIFVFIDCETIVCVRAQSAEEAVNILKISYPSQEYRFHTLRLTELDPLGKPGIIVDLTSEILQDNR